MSAPGDLPRLREGFRRARDVARQKPLDPFRGIETGPGPEARSDADVDAWIRSTAITAHHPAGTCQMGIGPDSVLDPELRVRGIERLREGFRRAREVARQAPLDPFRGVEISPGPQVSTDAEVDDWIRKVAITAHHPAGTCAMGIGPDSVLDPELRVRGIERLRVVDASAMPDLVSAHINACVLMMAEKAADLIRGRPALEAPASPDAT